MENTFTIKNAFKAEWIKIKGLGLLYLAIILGLLIPILIFIIKIFNESSRVYDGVLQKASTSDLEGTISGFGGFFMLIFIIIAASRISQIDHKNNGWTFLETQPISKLNIYSSKFLVLAVLSLFLFGTYFLSSLLFSQLSQLFYPQKELQYGVDFYWQFQSFVRLFTLSLGIISLQLMLSVIINGFVWPFIIGFLGFVLNVVASIFGFTFDYIPYNNIKTGLSFSDSSLLNHFFNYTEYLSVFWAILFFVIGFFWYSRRGFKNAFLTNKKSILLSSIGIACFAAVYFFITKPIYPERDGNLSVIEGSIQSPKTVKSIQIISQELGNIIAEVPVKDGKFHWESKEEFPLSQYSISFEGKSYPFLFSKGDLIDFDIKMNANKFEVSMKGTRKAEDLFMNSEENASGFYSYTVAQKLYADEPLKFYEEAQNEWKSKVKKIEKYRTNENIFYGKDFEQFQKQKNATQMLSAIYDYQKMTSFSDSKFAPPKEFLSELNSVLNKPSSLLLSTKDYKQYKLKEMLPKDGSKNPDSILFVKLSKMPSSLEKDQLLSAQIMKSIELENNEAKRNTLFNEKLTGIKDAQFKNYLVNQLQVINNQQKGKPFPDLRFQDETGKAVSLAKFKGKYVVIDFWATWCGPCKETSPVFEYQAKNHQFNDNIVFLSASIDEDKNKWKLDLKNTKSNVVQWWVSDQNMLKTLGVNSIPRFMMIDPNGKMYNANMPRPNETNFEDILEKVEGGNFTFRTVF